MQNPRYLKIFRAARANFINKNNSVFKNTFRAARTLNKWISVEKSDFSQNRNCFCFAERPISISTWISFSEKTNLTDRSA